MVTNQNHNKMSSSEIRIYQIRIESHLDSHWTNWFEDFTVTLEDNGDTTLTGSVVDQATLHRLLKKVRDLGVVLVAVNQINKMTLIKNDKEEL